MWYNKEDKKDQEKTLYWLKKAWTKEKKCDRIESTKRKRGNTMKQIYNRTLQWKFKDEKKIHDITFHRHFVFLEEEEATTKKYDINSFHTLVCNVENGFFWNAVFDYFNFVKRN